MADHDLNPKSVSHALSSEKLDFLQVQWIVPQGVIYNDTWLRSKNSTHCVCISDYPIPSGNNWILSELPAPAYIDLSMQHKPTPLQSGLGYVASDYVLVASVKGVGYGHESVTITFYQYEPIGDIETEIASFDVLASSEFMQQEFIFTVPQIIKISDWGRIRVRITNPHRYSRGIYVAQVCLRVPNGYIYEFVVCPENNAHAIISTNSAIEHLHILSPKDSGHTLTFDTAEVVQNPVVVADAVHVHVAQKPTIIHKHRITPDDCAHKFNTHQHIYVAHSQHTLTSTQAILYRNHEIAPQGATSAHAAQSPGISES